MGEGEVIGEAVNLSELETKSGAAKELPLHDRVRLNLAHRVLLAILVIIILSGIAMVCVPDNRIQQAETIFEFVKTIAPPIVTLVIGFYFRNEGSS